MSRYDLLLERQTLLPFKYSPSRPIRQTKYNATMITYADIVAARERIRDGIEATPCPHSTALSELLGCDVYCKLDFLQRTGSFKERGARNALLQLSQDERSRGVIAASAGNHALALACHGKLLGVPATVVMPRF